MTRLFQFRRATFALLFLVGFLSTATERAFAGDYYNGYFWVIASEPSKAAKEFSDLEFVRAVKEVRDRYAAKCGIDIAVWHSDFMMGFKPGYWVVFSVFDESEAGVQSRVGDDACSKEGQIRAGAASYPGFLGACVDDLDRCIAHYALPDGQFVANVSQMNEKARSTHENVLAGNPVGAGSCDFDRSVFESEVGNYVLEVRPSEEEGAGFFDFKLKPRYGVGLRFIGEAQWTNGYSSPRFVIRLDCRSLTDLADRAKCEKSPGVSSGTRMYGLSRRGDGLRDLSSESLGVGRKAPHFLLLPDLSRDIWYYTQYPSAKFEAPGDLFTFSRCE